MSESLGATGSLRLIIMNLLAVFTHDRFTTTHNNESPCRVYSQQVQELITYIHGHLESLLWP